MANSEAHAHVRFGSRLALRARPPNKYIHRSMEMLIVKEDKTMMRRCKYIDAHDFAALSIQNGKMHARLSAFAMKL